MHIEYPLHRKKNKTYQGICSKETTTILFQDGTNSILKKDKNVDVLFDKYINLLIAVDEKFNPDNLVLMQAPPLRNCQNNEMVNERINQLNVELEEYSKNLGKLHVTVLPIIDITLSLPFYNSLLYDDIHFSYSDDVPFLRRIILSVL